MLIKNTQNIIFKETKSRSDNGFTIMEIVVATTIFAFVITALLSLFSYTLKINRRTEALRQATQGLRNFMEFVAKEIRNGQIDYYVIRGTTNADDISPTSPCKHPANSGGDSYNDKENKLGLITDDGIEECIYFAKEDGSYVDTPGLGAPSNTFTAPAGSSYVLAMQKTGVGGVQILNPSNFKIDSLVFYIRPKKDPFVAAGGFAKMQPFVVLIMKARVKLPTGEIQDIYYQTSVSTNRYDLPS